MVLFSCFTTVLPNCGKMLLPSICFPLFLILLSFAFHAVNRRPHSLPVNWPVVGILPSFISNIHRVFDWGEAVLQQSRCNYVFKGPWFLGLDFLLVADPANVNHIVNLNHSNYLKGDDFTEIVDVVFGDGIFNSFGDSWWHQRKKAHTHMSAKEFRASVATVSRAKVENGLLPLMTHLAHRREAVDLQDVFLRLTFDLTCDIILGVDPGCLSVGFPTIPFCKAVDDVEEVMFFRHTVPGFWWKLLRWLRVGQERRLAVARELIDRFLLENVARMRKQVKKKRDGKEAMAAGLLSSYLDDPVIDMGSDAFLSDTALNFLEAGRSTTASALTWFYYMIAKNPDVEAKILKELRGLGPSKVFDPKELGGLVYLHAALCEALRLFPPVPLNHKAAVRDDVLPSGHRVRPGARILICMHAMARMKEVWGEDCSEFRPERWISEKGRLRHEPSYKFIAFGSGPRNCLGRDVALTQIKVAVAAMVYNFEVEVVKGHVVQPNLSIILHVKNGLMVHIKKRRVEGEAQ